MLLDFLPYYDGTLSFRLYDDELFELISKLQKGKYWNKECLVQLVN